MILRVEAALCEPPSSISVFRDATLYASIFAHLDVLLKCEKGTRSLYWKWLKKYGAHDFVKELILPEEELDSPLVARKKANIRVDRLDENSIDFVVSAINGLTQERY